MRISIEIDLGITNLIRTVKQKWLGFVCQKKGHIWTKYQWGDDYYPPFLMGLNRVTHECSRCGELKFRKTPKKRTIRFKRYSELKT